MIQGLSFTALRTCLREDDTDALERLLKRLVPWVPSMVLGAAVRTGTPKTVRFLMDRLKCNVHPPFTAQSMMVPAFYLTAIHEVPEPGRASMSDWALRRIAYAHSINSLECLDDMTNPRLAGMDDGWNYICHTDTDYESNLDYLNDVADPDTYTENLKVLLSDAERIGFDPDQAVVWAHVMGDRVVRDCFSRAGMNGVSDEFRAKLTATHNCATNHDYGEREVLRMARYLATYATERAVSGCESDALQAADAMDRLKELAQGTLYTPFTQRYMSMCLLIEELPDRFMFSLFDGTSSGARYGRKKMMYAALRHKRRDLFTLGLQAGYARTWRDFDDMEAAVRDTGEAPDLLSAVMTARRNSGVKPPKPAPMNPYSNTALRRTWGTRELADGSLKITSYRGTPGTMIDVVRVPSEIGGRAVTQIAEKAFLVRASRTPEICQARLAVREIILPGTIRSVKLDTHDTGLERLVVEQGCREIRNWSFWATDNLKELTLPDSLVDIGFHAFSACRNIERVRTSPGSVADRHFDNPMFH